MRSSPPRRLVVLIVALASLLVAPRPARATPNFPPAIQAALGAVSAPDCSVCHVGRTGRGTVNTSFGSAMRSRGLVAYDEASLRRALEAMEAAKVDGDGDGILDVDALRGGKNPNPAGADLVDIEPVSPEYGCVGRISRTSAPEGAPLAFGLALALTAALRRSRTRRGARLWTSSLAVVLGLAGAAGSTACSPTWSGAHLAPRQEGVREAGPPAMAALKPSAFEAELRAIGLDPMALPPFEALDARQQRRVMSTFSRSLGYACTDCHDRGAPSSRTATRRKQMAAKMWNDMMRTYSPEGGGAVYCDSCHQGQGRFLARDDKKAVANWMAENLTGKLKVAQEGKRIDLECETCHGPSFDPRFLASWSPLP